MKNILKIVFVIIGTLIGAGFASGQEMYIFFFSYGIKGLIGIVVSSLLMGLIIYKTLILLNKYDIKTYKEFLDFIVGNKKNRINKININRDLIKNVVGMVINVFTLVTFFIMIAGFGAYFEQEFKIESLIGSGILAILTFTIFLTSIKGVIKVNGILIPMLILFLLIIGITNIMYIFTSTNSITLSNNIINVKGIRFILDAIIYSSYNSILLIPVLITLKRYLKNKKQIVAISVISTLIIIILSIIIFSLLLKIDVNIAELEMPAVYSVSRMNDIFKSIYAFIILGSIFTTSISLGTSFLQNVVKNEKSYTQVALIMCITSVAISKLGFSNLINLLYPIFGYLGLLQTFRIIIVAK